MPAGASCSFPTLVPRGEPHCECLLVSFSFGTSQPVGHQDLKFASLPILSIFSGTPTYLGSNFFLLFAFVQLAMCQDSPRPRSSVLPWPWKTSQSFRVPDWEGTAHTGGREERNWGVCSEIRHSNMGQRWFARSVESCTGGLLEGYPGTDKGCSEEDPANTTQHALNVWGLGTSSWAHL